MSNWVCHDGGMINRHPSTKPAIRTRILTSFGRANLVGTGGSNYELQGATEEEFTAAKEWISLFLHEATLSDGPILQRRETNNSRWKLSSLGRSE